MIWLILALVGCISILAHRNMRPEDAPELLVRYGGTLEASQSEYDAIPSWEGHLPTNIFASLKQIYDQGLSTHFEAKELTLQTHFTEMLSPGYQHQKVR